MSVESTNLQPIPSLDQTNRLPYAKRLIAVLGAVTHVITRKLGRRELLREVCRILVEAGGFRMAWFGVPDVGGWVVPEATFGDTLGYLAGIRVSVHDVPQGRGPIGTALRENRSTIFNNIQANQAMRPWHLSAARNGFNSCAGFPVRLPSGELASLNLYSTECDFFSSDEEALIVEICACIGYALEFAAAEEERVEAAAQLARTQVIAKVGGWSADLLTGMSTNSPQASRINGLPTYPVPWEMYTARIDPADMTRCWQAWEHAVSTGEPYDVEHRIKVDGVWKWVHSLAEVECDVTGHPVRVVGMTQDITERKGAQETEDRFRVIFENAGEGIIVVDLEEPEGPFLMVNPAGCALFGYPKEEFLRLSVPDLHPAESLLEVLIQVEALTTGKITVARSLPCRRRDGSTFHANVASSPMILQGKKCLVGFFSDVSQQRRAESELREQAELLRMEVEERRKDQKLLHEQQRQLEDLNGALKELVANEVQKNRNKELELMESGRMASVGQLAAGVAHEINNPMAFITCNLSTLAEFFCQILRYDQLIQGIGADLPLPLRELMEESRESLGMEYILTDGVDLIAESLEGAQRVSKIVRDLQTFAREDASEHELTDLTSCLESALTLADTDLKYVAAIRKEYGPKQEIFCHPGRLNQVFMNLLINAGQAITPPGEILLRSWHDDHFVYASVSDTGKGISEEHRQRLFEPFFTTREVGKGTGLGLSIAYEIVKKHDGTIWVESKVGVGTTFTVKFPRNPDDPQGTAKLQALAPIMETV